MKHGARVESEQGSVGLPGHFRKQVYLPNPLALGIKLTIPLRLFGGALFILLPPVRHELFVGLSEDGLHMIVEPVQDAVV